MIIPRLMGGLGNQMFQIAAAKAHALKNNVEFRAIEKGHVLPYQGFKFKKYNKSVFRNVQTIDSIPEGIQSYTYLDCPYKEIPDSKNLFITGYFQSEKYFKVYANAIRNLFSISDEIKEYILDKYPNISKNSISIHVRRGDYVQLQHVHELQPIGYYKQALEIIKNTQNIYVFSDDIHWCKKNLSFANNFVDEEDDISLYMMSLCSNNIMANSSFSWWAAWLNQNPSKKVIAPKKWFGKGGPRGTQDLIPKEWAVI
jgi:hypothetical protein